MSMEPSVNPYMPTRLDDQEFQSSKVPLRGFVKVVCIFFIVLGVLGLLQFIQFIFGMLFNLGMAANDENGFNAMNLFPGALALGILFGIINAVVSVGEIIGGIMGLQQKRLGANLIRFISGFMILFKIIETAYGCVATYLMKGPLKEQTIKQMQQQPDAPDMSQFFDIMIFIGIGFAILFGLIMFVFYLFAFLSFSKQQTLSQFS